MFEGSLQPLRVEEIPKTDVMAWLSGNRDVDIWVVEDYFVRPANKKGGYSHEWNRGDTLRIIGAIEYHAFMFGAEFVLQQPSQKVMGYKLMGKEYKKGKGGMHIFDAIAHAQVFFGKNPRYLEGE